jgi:hypothetical protein
MEDIFSNSLVLKVLGGTVSSMENMCATCRNASIRVGAYSGRKTVSCLADYYHPIELREPVAQCNRYIDSRRPTIEQMKEIAWELMTNKGGTKIGFRSPEERRQDDRKGQPGF